MPSLRIGSRLLALAATASLAACGTGVTTTGSSNVTGPGASTLPVSLPARSAGPVDLSTVPSRVHVEGSAGTSGWIGPAGGALTARAADGTTYRLDIPPLALRDPVAIQMTPIGSIDDLELSGGLAGAVYLGPAGLQLDAPAILTITASKSAPAGTRLVGFDVGDDGTTALVPSTGNSASVAIHVFHFSAPGAGYGTSEDLLRFGPSPSNPITADIRITHGISQLLAEDTPWSPATMADAYAFIQLVWGASVRNELTTVHDDTTLLVDLADWRQLVFLMNLYAHRGDVAAALADGLAAPGPFPELMDPSPFFQAGQVLVGQRIADAIQGNTQRCTQSHDLVALANIWFWAAIGDADAPITGGSWTSSATACADLALPVANPPSSMDVGQTGTAFLQFAMAFADGTRTPVDVQTSLQASGMSLGAPGTSTASAGVAAGTTLTEPLLAQAAPPYGLTIHACWSLDGVIRALCKTFEKTFGGPTSPPTQAPTPTSNATGPDWSSLAGTYAVRLICENAQYGTGTATVTVAGQHLEMHWQVTITPGGGQPDCDQQAGGQPGFPTSGSFAGTIQGLVAGGGVAIALTSWQVSPCIDAASVPPTSAGFVNGNIGIPISTCVLSSLLGRMGYQATRTGP